MTPSQRYTHHCQEARVHMDTWLSQHCPGCGNPFADCNCVGVAECYTCDRPLHLCVCEMREHAEGRDYHDERTEDIESGKPPSNGSAFYTEET